MEIYNSTIAPASSAFIFPVPTGDNYSILTDLAKRRNLKTQDVPGDGNCFFHAVSESLITARVQQISGSKIRAKLIDYLENTDSQEYYFGFLEIPNNQAVLPINVSVAEQQKQQFEYHVDGLRNNEWADNLAVQTVADMLSINTEVINTITPEWVHDIHPRHHRSQHTITIGLMGEMHYVAFENAEVDFRQESESEATKRRQELEDEQDRIAFDHTSKLRGIPYDTLLQEEQLADADTFSLAPGENQKPCPFLTDENFEELANPSKYPLNVEDCLARNTRK